VRSARAAFEELGLKQAVASSALWMEGRIHFLQQRYADAERCLRESCAAVESIGDYLHLSTFSAELADVLHTEHQDEEALQWTEKAERFASSDDLNARFSWRSVRAKILARHGMLPEAISLSDEALTLVASTDALTQHASVLMDRAEVLRAAQQFGDAARSAEEALRLFEAKGNVVAARHARTLVEEFAVA
jgi:tetratricopeptide (TPR) repeat protein